MKRSGRSARVRFRRIGLVAKSISPEAIDLARAIERALADRGLPVCLDGETARALRDESGVPRDRIARLSDLVIVLGGDGTLLSVARTAPARTPVLGINTGMLGFLAGLSREQALARLDEVLAGGFREDRRRRLDVTLSEGPFRGHYRALNDAVLNKEAIARISTFSIALDGKPVSEFRADGVIVSTPTGSTAYNLSAGGPILHPSLQAVVVTPICPHTLTQRPLVVPDSISIGLRVLDRGRRDGVHLTLDGQEGFPVPMECTVQVRASSSLVTLLRPPESDHFDNLAEKLNWGV
jgi:NAD+ kinase